MSTPSATSAADSAGWTPVGRVAFTALDHAGFTKPPAFD
jgi:hypothetical protein